TVLQEGAGECDALSLAPRELRAALADLRVITPRQAYDELVRVGGVRGSDDLLPARPRRGVRDVLGDAGRKEHRVLKHHRELAAQVVELVIAQVDAVQQDLPRGRVVKAREQADQRGLAGPGRPDHSEPRSRLDLERDI